MRETLIQKVAEHFALIWKFLKEEFVRITVSVIIEGTFFSLSAYYGINKMETLFYISVSVTVIAGIFLMIHWFIVVSGKARKEFEQDMKDLMNILAVIQMYRAEKQYQGRWQRGDYDAIYNYFIQPELTKERDAVEKFLNHHLPDMTPNRRNYLLSKFYELSRN